MNSYKVPFWIVIAIIPVFLSILIWLSIVKSRDNQLSQLCHTSVSVILEQYIQRVFERTLYLFLKYENFTAKKGIDIRLEMHQREWTQEMMKTMSHRLVYFPRAHEIVTSLIQQMKKKHVDLFLLPDILIAHNDYYRSLLLAVAETVTNQVQDFQSYDNDQAKQYLLTLSKRVSTEKSKGKAEITYY